MIEVMKIKQGLVFTLPNKSEHAMLQGGTLDETTEYVRLKVVSVNKKDVECSFLGLSDEPIGQTIDIDIERIAEDGTIVEEKKEMVQHPSHYAWLKDLCGVEPLDICRNLDFNCGSIIKYILRKGKKEMNLDERQQRIQDLKKAKVYLEDEIKMLENQK